MKNTDLLNQIVNTFTCCTAPNVNNNVELRDWISTVKDGNEHIFTISYARNHLQELDVIKKTKLPTVCYTATFNSYRAKEHIIDTTGLVLIDLDMKNNPDLTPDEMKEWLIENRPDLFICYKSISNCGVTALFYSEDVTIQNYSWVSESLTNTLPDNLKMYVDTGASTDVTRQSTISYDPDIYINSDLIPFSYSSSSSIKSNNNASNSTLDIKREGVHRSDTFLKPENDKYTLPFVLPSNQNRYDVILDCYYENDLVYIPDGKLYFRCQLPFNISGQIKKIEIGQREQVIGKFTTNLICLNRYDDDTILEIIKHINWNHCVEPLDVNEIYSIVFKRIKLWNDGRLNPVDIRMKKYWINPDYRGDKLKLLGTTRIENTIEKLNGFFELLLEYENKITYQTIAEFTGLSLITVKRRVTDEMKQLIKNHNKEIKENMKS